MKGIELVLRLVGVVKIERKLAYIDIRFDLFWILNCFLMVLSTKVFMRKYRSF